MGQKAEFNHNRTAQIFGAHDIQWIREGTPGVGNFLIFDNGMFRPSERPRSAVLEIDVHDEEMGQYIWQHEAGYKVLDPPLEREQVSNQVVGYWVLHSYDGTRLYQDHAQGAKKMPNGNIMAATGDRVVELSPEGDVVWGYRGLSEFERFAPDHSLFAEWDMTPKGRLADRAEPGGRPGPGAVGGGGQLIN